MKHTVKQNTKSFTITPTSFLKETCFHYLLSDVESRYIYVDFLSCLIFFTLY